MLKAQSYECRHETPANEEELLRKAAKVWNVTRRKGLVDIYDITDNDFKQKVINYCDNKYGKVK
jgi:hypothetical protein